MWFRRALVVALAIALVGCGSANNPAPAPAPNPAPAAPPPPPPYAAGCAALPPSAIPLSTGPYNSLLYSSSDGSMNSNISLILGTINAARIEDPVKDAVGVASGNLSLPDPTGYSMQGSTYQYCASDVTPTLIPGELYQDTYITMTLNGSIQVPTYAVSPFTISPYGTGYNTPPPTPTLTVAPIQIQIGGSNGCSAGLSSGRLVGCVLVTIGGQTYYYQAGSSMSSGYSGSYCQYGYGC